ncbi:MAG TPA: hypothetical protein PLC05_02395 [bacterium]|nr:hypothetical protein [bacterium]HOR57618.1 hypothetical protein [bacterium]HPL56333.1 hypothetical protein [bacterium]
MTYKREVRLSTQAVLQLTVRAILVFSFCHASSNYLYSSKHYST